MTVWKRANPILQQVPFIIARAKGGFILFDGVYLMFKYLSTLYGMHKFSFFKQTIYIVLMTNVFFDYVLLHSLCLLNFFFLFCFHRIHLRLQTNKFSYNFPVQLIPHFTDYFFVFIIIERTFFLACTKIEQIFISIRDFVRVIHLNLIREAIRICK